MYGKPADAATRSTSVAGTSCRVTLRWTRRLERLLAGFASVPFSMPLGLIDGRASAPLSRANPPCCSIITRFSSAVSPSDCTTSDLLPSGPSIIVRALPVNS